MTVIKACTKCFSRRVKRHYRDKNIRVDYFPLVIDWVCEDCGYKGIPIVFCNEEDYVKFVSVVEENKESSEKQEDDRDQED